jgi:glyoxylase-like metal-dependent hydrolase (beta-lactamase superfamily II)
MGKVREMAEKLWSGELSTAEFHPLTSFFGIEELAGDLAFISSFANVAAIDSGDGLILIDTGTHFTAPINRGQLREWSDRRIDTAVYTHGHVDHVLGMPLFDKEAAERGDPRPRVIAHERVVDRFERYRLTAGYNASINARQFRVSRSMWPTEYRAPDETYRDRRELSVGGVTLELHHDRGETDDHTWVWWAERRALFTGDLFIWASPNCGNPQKAQRYPREWAAALDKMAALEPELLLPGHGPPIFGADRCRQALADTAELLRSITEQTLALMNDGARAARAAVSAAGLRRAGVHRPQPVAPLWRLVRRQSGAAQAGGRRRRRARGRRARGRRRCVDRPGAERSSIGRSGAGLPADRVGLAGGPKRRRGQRRAGRDL